MAERWVTRERITAVLSEVLEAHGMVNALSRGLSHMPGIAVGALRDPRGLLLLSRLASCPDLI